MDKSDTEATVQGDLIVIVSSELISEIMERYFNDVRFKTPVKVIDVTPTGTGLMCVLVDEVEDGYAVPGEILSGIERNSRHYTVDDLINEVKGKVEQDGLDINYEEASKELHKVMPKRHSKKNEKGRFVK